MNEHVKSVEGTSRITTEKGALEYYARRLYPNYAYNRCLLITGVYRPPDNPNRNYAADLKELVPPIRKKSLPIIKAGDLNINAWGKENENWLWGEELWELANPNVPTHEAGATVDAMLFMPAQYIPEGILSGAAETGKGIQMEEHYPVHTAGKQVIRDHVAQTLTLHTLRPDTRSDCKRYNVRGRYRSEWEKQQTKIVATPENR